MPGGTCVGWAGGAAWGAESVGRESDVRSVRSCSEGRDLSMHVWIPVGVIIVVISVIPCLGALSENLLTNGSFDQGVDAKGVPVGWSLYGGGGARQLIEPIAEAGEEGILIDDGDPAQEIGLTQSCPAEPGLTYQASVPVRCV